MRREPPGLAASVLPQVYERIAQLEQEAQRAHQERELHSMQIQQLQADLGNYERQALANDRRSSNNNIKFPKPDPLNSTKTEDLRRFFADIKQQLLGRGYNPNDVATVRWVALHFADPAAKDWWELQTDKDDTLRHIPDVDTLRERLMQNFSGRDRKKTAMDNLHEAKQGNNSVTSYAKYYRQNVLHVPHRTEEDNTHGFLRGLTNELRLAIAALGTNEEPKTLDAAVQKALELEAAMQRARKGKRGDAASLNYVADFHDSDDSEENDDDTYSEELNAVQNGRNRGRSQAELAKLSKAGKCFYCEERGHLARDCPKKQQQQQRGK